MSRPRTTAQRRLPRVLATASAVALLAGTAGCGSPSSNSAGAAVTALPALPSRPVALNIVDVGGASQLTKAAIDRFAKDHANIVSGITITKAPAPELAGKIKAEQGAGRLDIDMVLTGVDGLSSGQASDVWQPILPNFAAKFPQLTENYQPGAAAMQELAKGQAIEVVYSPGGPFLEYMPGEVSAPPDSPETLLAWAKAHPNKFEYARPANSGPGRTFLMSLPYLLGDKDPKDPINGWDKTWAYLKELDAAIEYYPTGTGVTMKELGDGTRSMVATQMGWYINPRVLGTVPLDAKVQSFSAHTFVTDAQYMAVPKGLDKDKLAVVLELMAYMMQPQQQAEAWDSGYFYPGPAVKNVPLTMAPPASQTTLAKFGYPEFDKMIDTYTPKTPLSGKSLTDAFDKWDREIGGAKVKKS